jgi:hypothetical protein
MDHEVRSSLERPKITHGTTEREDRMNFTLSIFDLFAYTIPGSLYLVLLLYISDRLDWLDLRGAENLNTAFLLIGAALASYLLGHITYQLGRLVDRVLLPSWRTGLPGPKQQFLSHVPTPKARLLVQVDPYLLLTAAEIRTQEGAVEISRLRAGGLMLRTAVPALLLGFMVSLVELIVGNNRPFAALYSIVFILAALSALRHGREQSEWAVHKTFEVAFWIPEVDDLIKSWNASPPRDPVQHGDS